MIQIFSETCLSPKQNGTEIAPCQDAGVSVTISSGIEEPAYHMPGTLGYLEVEGLG